MNTIFALTPINQTEGLPDGWYIAPRLNGLQTTMALFHEGKWLILSPNKLQGYLRPLAATIPLTKEKAGEIWDDGWDTCAKNGTGYPNLFPDRRAYIDKLFEKK